MKNLINKKNLNKIVATGILLFGIMTVYLFIFKRMRAYFDSDYTDTILWAKTALDAHKLFNPAFYYAYILPFSGVLFMIPAVKLFGVTMLAQEVGMALFAVFLGIMLCVGCKVMGFKYEESAVTIGIFLCVVSSSITSRMIFWGHNINYSLPLPFLCVSIYILSKIDLSKRFDKKETMMFGLLLVWNILCCTNGLGCILLYAFPFLGALILKRLLEKKDFTRDDMLWARRIALLFVSFVIGYVIFSISQKGLQISYENEYYNIVPSEQWFWKKEGLLRQWVTLFADTNDKRIPAYTVDGVIIAAKYVLSLIVLIVPFASLFSYKKIENEAIKIMILTHLCLMAIVFIVYSITGAGDNSWRLCVVMASSSFIAIVYILWLMKNAKQNRWGNLLLVALVLCSIVVSFSIYKIPSRIGFNRYDALIEFCKANNLSYGYGDFWDASVTTVLSDGEVKIRPIEVDEDGAYNIRYYQSEPSWYDDSNCEGKWFVLLSQESKERAKDTLCANALEEIKFDDDGYIFVFDENIFDNYNRKY